MTAICPSSILACGMRVTLLDAEGDVSSDPNNYWVTDNLIDIATNPDVDTGPDLVLRGGCDCGIATYKGNDIFKRFNFEINLGTIESGLLSMMLGGEVILDGTDPIGMSWPNFSCDNPQPKVALEVWSYAWEGAAQSETFPYWHWVWPLTKWQIGPSTLGATDFFRPALTGFSLGNPRWGHGPYDDDPGSAIGEMGAFWLTTDPPPTAACAYGTITPSS